MENTAGRVLTRIAQSRPWKASPTATPKDLQPTQIDTAPAECHAPRHTSPSHPTMLLINALRYKAWADARSLAAAARLLAQPEPHTSTNSEAVPPLQALHERLTASNHWLQAYAPSLTADKLGETLHFRFLDGQAGSLKREEILFHLINHGTYHRGAIGHALDQAGGLRPADTYTVFVHEVEVGRRGGG